ncbi:Permuted papain-like amidase enzyme, YaeF/YiiX, C92 family [Pustulibacterium marinum]|uniref:Permuted papain-like amidase enzyme, YaeF/YiiX, C92 family n=2 Tax=Pustulibacterium marinum TaxID=1224947 RepID=A0A1I7H6V1_9FLAO|nr:Permuted papain-like amidase enzyme, YaeF/YiiX, C92 family [Pustulibacterium marinum]
MFFLGVILASMAVQGQDIDLKSGDILFRESAESSLSKAIDAVTQTDKATHFSHVGMVEKVGDSIFVLHAEPEGGSCKITLKEFIYPKEDSIYKPRKVVAYRLKSEYQQSIPTAIEKAKGMLGKPYNYSYVMNDDSYYCSGFVYRAFEKDSIFKLNPMTFKNPNTGEFNQSWIDFYKDLGMEVPEGKLGCNPNGMAASEKLKILGEIMLKK